MPEASQKSWADRLKEMNSDGPKFTPLENDRYNFQIVEASVQDKGKGNFINMKIKVVDGPRQGHTMFHSVFPNANNVYFFTQFYQATGLSLDWLAQSDPTEDEIASNFLNRTFSADVEDSDRKNPTTNQPYKQLANIRSLEATTPSQAQAQNQPAPQQTQAPAPAQQNQNSGWGAAGNTNSPWGDSNGAPSNPFQ